MNKKKKIGFFLVLIGVGIALVLFFFQENGVMFTVRGHKTVERNLTPQEIDSLKLISELKERINELAPDYLSPEKFKIRDPNVLTTQELFDKKNITFEEYMDWVVTYENHLILAIKKAYGQNHFEKEAWNIQIYEEIEIPFRQIIGIGILIVLVGIGFFVSSYFVKERKQGSEK